MSDDPTMFDVEPMSWEELATRLQMEKIELCDEIERLRDVIRRAPHAGHCEAGAPFFPGACSCWKLTADSGPSDAAG